MLKMEKTDKSPRFKSNPRYSKLGLVVSRLFYKRRSGEKKHCWKRERKELVASDWIIVKDQ